MNLITRIFLILWELGYLLSLAFAITTGTRVLLKKRRIKYLYDYNRHYTNKTISAEFKSELSANQFRINEEQRTIDNYQGDLLFFSIPYTGTPMDYSRDVKYSDLISKGGWGGSGSSAAYYNLSNCSLNGSYSLICKTLCDISIPTSEDPDKMCHISNIYANIDVTIMSREMYDTLKFDPYRFFDGVYYIVDPKSEIHDEVLCIYGERINKIQRSTFDRIIQNSSTFSKTEILYEIEAKRKSNYRVFNSFNLYLRNEDVYD